MKETFYGFKIGYVITTFTHVIKLNQFWMVTIPKKDSMFNSSFWLGLHESNESL